MAVQLHPQLDLQIHKPMRYRELIFILSFIFSFALYSCDTAKVYDTVQDLDSNAWNEDAELLFDFSIEDTSARYTLYYSVRYDNSYPYYNLYINRQLEDSSGRFINKKVQGMDLFKANTGVPFGGGMGSKKDYLIIAEENYKFPYKGKYKVKLKQYMRQENLVGISAVGFRVEKITN